MNVKTHIANALDIAQNKSAYNEHAINILSNLHILAHIMQGTLHECKNMSIAEIIATIDDTPKPKSIPVHPGETILGEKNSDTTPNEGTTVFDIRYHANIPGVTHSIKILINLEAQQDYTPGYDLVTRGIYYGARMVSAQRNTEFTDSNYNDIKKVYSIWICTDAPNYAKNTITEYKIQQEKVHDKRMKLSNAPNSRFYIF